MRFGVGDRVVQQLQLLSSQPWTDSLECCCSRNRKEAFLPRKISKQWTGLGNSISRPERVIRALENQLARLPQTLHRCFLRMFFCLYVLVCFVLFSFEITPATSMWGNRTKWIERGTREKILLGRLSFPGISSKTFPSTFWKFLSFSDFPSLYFWTLYKCYLSNLSVLPERQNHSLLGITGVEKS